MMVLFQSIFSLYAWILTVTVFVLHYLIANVIMIFPLKNKSTIFYKLANFFLKSIFLLSRIRIVVHGRDNFPSDKNGVVISNHQSLLDVIILMAYLPQRIVFFAKKELGKVPVLNFDMKHMEHVLVDRGKKSSALAQLESMKDRLDKNLNAFIFPEGTRSNSSKILPFKRGAFHLAATAKKPIIPCYIHGSGKLLKKNERFIKPGIIHISIGTPIDDSFEESDKIVSKRLQEKAQAVVEQLQRDLIKDLH